MKRKMNTRNFLIALECYAYMNNIFQRQVRMAMIRELKREAGLDIKIQINNFLKSKVYSDLHDNFFNDRDPGSDFCIAFHQFWDARPFAMSYLDGDAFQRICDLVEAMIDCPPTHKSHLYHALNAAKRGEFPTPPASLSLAA